MELLKAEINLPVIVISVLVVAVLVAFLVYRNLKDKKELEEEMDAPAPPKGHHGDLDEDNPT
jgi:hypothetical protein